MKKIIEWLIDNIGTIICIIFIILVIALVLGYGFVLAEYGNKPINEVPTWVLWLMFQNR